MEGVRGQGLGAGWEIKDQSGKCKTTAKNAKKTMKGQRSKGAKAQRNKGKLDAQIGFVSRES